MANNYGIPSDIEKEIRKRDTNCVYCGKEMISPKSGGSRMDWATIEHLDHKPPFEYRPGQTKEDFPISCWRCNCILRKDKKLSVWLAEEYNKKDGKISPKTIAPVVKNYLRLYK